MWRIGQCSLTFMINDQEMFRRDKKKSYAVSLSSSSRCSHPERDKKVILTSHMLTSSPLPLHPAPTSTLIQASAAFLTYA